MHSRVKIVSASLLVLALSACLGNAPTSTVAADQLSPEQLIPPLNKAERKLSLKHSYELRVINGLLKRYHYKKFKLDDNFSGKILDHYIDQLDPVHVYFTQQDITGFNRHRNKFDDYIQDGDTRAAVDIFSTYQQRVKERSDFAIKRLAQAMQLDSDDSYQVDRKDAPFAKDKKALDSLWDKRIRNDYINQLLADKTEQEARKLLKTRYELLASRTAQIKDNELFQLIANAYATTLEPHTAYFSPRLSEEFNIQMSLSLSGIGAVLRAEDEYIKIVSIVPGGPADLSGKVHPGDRIIAVGEGKSEPVDVIGWRLTDVVNLIRGKKGSTVVLSLLPAATGLSGSAEKVAIIRDKIKLEHQAASSRVINIKDDDGETLKVGIIDLPSFYVDFQGKENGNKNYRSTSGDIRRLLTELKKQSIDELIIDLRGNGGGSLSEVVKLTGFFIDRGPVVQINDTDGNTEVLSDRDPGVLYDGPLAVMIDKGSASASEIFAGAIQDYKRGIIIGEASFGKGTVQTVLPLNSYARNKFGNTLGQLKVTTAQFFRVNGDSTQHRGVVPDINWNLPQADGDFGERAFDNALPWRKIAQTRYPAYKHSYAISALDLAKRNSVERLKKTPKYLATINKLKLLVESGNEKFVSLNYQNRKAKREKFNRDLLEIENRLQAADQLQTYKTIKELQDAQQAQSDDIFNRDKKPIDVFIKEAALILNDLYRRNSNPEQSAVISGHARFN